MFALYGIQTRVCVCQEKFLSKAAANALQRFKPTKIQLANFTAKVAYNAQFVYYFHARERLRKARVYHWYMDGSAIGGYPSELIFIWSPEEKVGAYAPVLARASRCVFYFRVEHCKAPKQGPNKTKIGPKLNIACQFLG